MNKEAVLFAQWIGATCEVRHISYHYNGKVYYFHNLEDMENLYKEFLKYNR